MKLVILSFISFFFIFMHVNALNPHDISNIEGFNVTHQNTEVNIKFWTFNPGNIRQPIRQPLQANNNPELIINRIDENIKFGLRINLPNRNWEVHLIFISNREMYFSEAQNFGVYDYI